jgi:hypothetical protein
MKRLFVLTMLLAMVMCCGCGSDATQEEISAAVGTMQEATAVERCEITESEQRNIYTGQGRYSIALCDGVIEVTLRLNLVGEFVTDDLKERYKAGIEEVWNTDRFEVPIRIVIVWTDEDPHWTIKVHRCSVGWDTSNWCTGGWVERSASHEVGHYLGLFDEYGGGDAQGWDGGSAPGPRAPHERGLMNISTRPTLDYYYDAILYWYGVD